MTEEVEWLAWLAYPEAQAEMLDLLAKDQFIDAITDGDVSTAETERPKEFA